MLAISSLCVQTQGKQILKGVDLTVKSGEFHVVMGPNGGGKSTLTQTLMGNPNYQIVDNSKVTMDGVDLLELSPDERAQKGLFLAFQYPVAIPGVSVQNFLWKAFQATHQNTQLTVLEFRRRLTEKAASLHISPELLKRSLNDGFSGGEKKRVEILQLLALEPKYIMLDEIDSGLDIDAIGQVAAGLQKAREAFSPGILLITHYRRILDYLQPDFVHVLSKGRIVMTGGMEVVERLETSGYSALEKEE